MDEAAQALHIERRVDAINIGRPHAEPLRPRLLFACQELGDAGPVVGERVYPGKAPSDQLLLEPEAVLTLHHEHLSRAGPGAARQI